MSDFYNPQPLPPLNPNLDVTQNHYWSYHRLEALLDCKQPLTASQDEDLFIAVHQICELAFHQMILDMERVLELLALALQVEANEIIHDPSEVCYFFQRILRLYEVVGVTMPILTTMRAFAEFRTTIGPTSGFQSFQFRHLEIMSGLPKYWEGGTKDEQGQPHVAETEFDRRYGAQIEQWLERHHQHNLRHYYTLLVSRAAGNTLAERVQSLLHHPRANSVLKAMQAYDELQTRFHRSHLGLAIQQLKIVGADVGTGGTSFRDYLAKYERELAPLFPGLSTKN
jgi:tryptophan 2,3-dioxygenase